MKKYTILLLLTCCLSSIVFGQKSISYPNFPEDFESPDTSAKSHYKKGIAVLKTGSWTLDQAILGALSGHDHFNPAGKQSIRMQQNQSKPAFLEMNFDLPEGASKVSVSYASYFKDAPCSWRLEYSTDQGNTWQQTGSDITSTERALKTADFTMDIPGKVRFRINKLGLGDGKTDASIKNGRLSIDDIMIYKR